MLDELDQNQIDAILHSESIGRIGCHMDGRTYIVPIQYAYDGVYVYAHSIDGMKVRMMRANPELCFQVDRITNFSNWLSIIAWGTFEELTGEEAATTIHLLAQRLTTLIASGLSLHEMRRTDTSQWHMVVYRIRLGEKTGRIESTI